MILGLGGTGFIGAHVTRRLAADGRDVVVMHRGETQAALPPTVRTVRGPRESLGDALAGLGPVDAVVDMICLTERDALGLVAASRGRVRRLVVVSSADVYQSYEGFLRLANPPIDPAPLEETAPLRTVLYPYRSSAPSPDHWTAFYEKVMVERVASGQTDLPATILRLPMVYGPADKQRRTASYLAQMDAGHPAIFLGSTLGSWRTAHGYVEDVAAAIALAASSREAAGRIYNVGEAVSITEAECVGAIGRAAGWTGRTVVVPDNEWPPTLPYDFRYHLDTNTAKIRHELGYEEPIGRLEGLARTIKWERTQPRVPVPTRDEAKERDLIARYAR